MDGQNDNQTKTDRVVNQDRPDWDEYFIGVMQAVSVRATCDRGKSGAVLVRDNRILMTGYVGAPSCFPHCDEAGHLIKKVIHEDGSESNHCTRTLHAEMNIICQAAKFGVSTDRATLYCKMVPCYICAMMVVSSGIKRVVCEKKYHQGHESILKKAGIEITVINNLTEEYSNQ